MWAFDWVLERIAMFLQAQEGTVAIEISIVAPVLAAILVPTIDLGMGFYQQMQVQNAAQAGAQYAMEHGWNSGAIQNAVTRATTLTAVSASPAPTNGCGCPGSTSISAAACGSKCPDGQSAGTYVVVNAQATYTMLIPYPALGSAVILTAQATARIQ